MSDRIRKCEDEAERARARLDLHLDLLQSRLTLDSLADEALGAIRRSPYGQFADDALATVRRNPIPVILAGAAMAVFAVALGEERARRMRRERPNGTGTGTGTGWSHPEPETAQGGRREALGVAAAGASSGPLGHRNADPVGMQSIEPTGVHDAKNHQDDPTRRP